MIDLVVKIHEAIQGQNTLPQPRSHLGHAISAL